MTRKLEEKLRRNELWPVEVQGEQDAAQCNLRNEKDQYS